MELRQYFQVVMRHLWLVIAVGVIGAGVSLLLHVSRTPEYSATADVLLLPNNPLERLNPVEASNDPDRHAAVQVSVITSPAVVAAAVKAEGGGDVDEFLKGVSVDSGERNNILSVHVTDRDPARARNRANALARAYIEDRRQVAASSLIKAADRIGVRLAALKAQIEAPAPGPGSGPAQEAATLQYQSLYLRQQDLLIEADLKRGEAELIRAARQSQVPVGVSAETAVILGGLLGFMVGLGLLFLCEQLDDRVMSRDEVERITGLPVLAEIPLERKSARQPTYVATAEDPLGHLAEASRSLRTALNFLGVDEPVKRLLVTSAMKDDGKTTVVANLGVAYAQAGFRTVLVSADLRRPRLERMFTEEPMPIGLTDVLLHDHPLVHDHALAEPDDRSAARRWALGRPADEADGQKRSPQRVKRLPDVLQQALVQTEVANLSLLPTGPLPPNPAELLSSSRMDEVLESLSQRFDIVVVDAPAVLAVADAAALAQKVGHLMLVVGMGRTHRQAVERMAAVARTTPVHVLGVVLNRVKSKDNRYVGTYTKDRQEPSRVRGRRSRARSLAGTKV